MRNILTLMFAIILLTSLASAEIYMWNEVSNLEGNITTLHGLYTIKDIEPLFVDFIYDVEIHYSTQSLPYSLTYGVVDYCNFTYTHYANDYDSEGNYIGTTTTNSTLNFDSGLSSGVIELEMREQDNLITDMKCHYTDNRSQYQDNILVGRYSFYAPSTECRGCTEFSLEELSNELERSQEITESELEIYGTIDTLIELNHRLWLYASWLIKIFLLVFSVGLVFMGIYHLYKFLEDVARRI